MCIVFLFRWPLTALPLPLLHDSLFKQFPASALHEYFYLQGCVFFVFVLLCLIDSNMGFLNGLSSDLFPQELMTQMISEMHDENADLCGLKQLDLLPFILQTLIKTSKMAECCEHGTRRLRNCQYSCVSLAVPLCWLEARGVLRQVRSPVHTLTCSLPIRLVNQTMRATEHSWEKNGDINKIWIVQTVLQQVQGAPEVSVGPPTWSTDVCYQEGHEKC